MNEIIVGVPGPWETESDLRQALARVHGADYLLAGRIFMEPKAGATCQIQFDGPNDDLRQAFEFAGQGRVPESTLDAVAAHRSTAYLILLSPSLDTARTAARFARVLLEAGGVGVKVESAGVAHTPERWLEMWDAEDPFAIYTLFVCLVIGDGRFFSCGMHNFGLPDAAAPASMGPEEGARLLNVFNNYQLAERPALKDGHTFSVDAEGPRFRLIHEPFEPGYEPDEPLFNPHGLWALRSV